MGNQQRDIKKSFRLPAELNTRAESLLKKDRFKIFSFSDITILALNEFLEKYESNSGSKDLYISKYLAGSKKPTQSKTKKDK